MAGSIKQKTATRENFSTASACQHAEHLTILGGGLAGLSSGFYCKKSGIPFTIYEEKNEPGGNCVTFRYGNFSFDSGSHRFHDVFPDITRDIVSLLKDDLRKIHVPSQIFFQNRFYDFPLSPLNLIKNLGLGRFSQACFEIAQARAKKADLGNTNFKNFALSTYGKTIAESFLLNYTEKLWGTPCENLLPTIARRRLKGLNLSTFLKEAFFGHRAKTTHLDGSFYYPKSGIGMIPTKLCDFCDPKNIKTQAKITKIYHDQRRIHSVLINDRDKVDVEQVLSTLPLSLFVQVMDPPLPNKILDLANKLRYRSLVLFVVFLDKESITNYATVYFPQSEFLFTRLYEPKNRSPFMAPSGKTSLVAELPCQAGDQIAEMDNDRLQRRICEQLTDLGWVDSDQIIDSKIVRLPYAYPVLEIETENNVKKIIEYLEGFQNLKTIGRNGRFTYTHIHDSFKLSQELVQNYCTLS
jgi:protoporphyrinogen oxidase